MYLEAQIPTLVAGTRLFEGPMPELPSSSDAGPHVAITHYMSEAPDSHVMGPSLQAAGYEIESVQVETRHLVKDTAQSTAAAIHALLANFHSADINGRLYFLIEDDGPPDNHLGQDQNMRWRYTANYHCKKARG